MLLVGHKSHVDAFLFCLFCKAAQTTFSGFLGLLLLQKFLSLNLFLHLFHRLLLFARSGHGTIVEHQIRYQSRDFEAIFHFDHHHSGIYNFRNLATANGAKEIYFISYFKLCHNFSFLSGKITHFGRIFVISPSNSERDDENTAHSYAFGGPGARFVQKTSDLR